MIRTGAQLICESLLREGVDVIFGLPGGAILPLYQTLPQYPELRHILVRHEQGAAHAADGYARVTGRPGVAWATSGPGATNLVTGIATAQMDSVPMVAVVGQVMRAAIGSDAFQETDTTGISLPVTQAQPPRSVRRGDPADRQGDVPHRLHGPAGAGAHRRAQGRPDRRGVASLRQLRRVLRERGDRSAGLQADAGGQRAADQEGPPS